MTHLFARRDTTAIAALSASDAPYWAAVEWLHSGPQTEQAWLEAMRTTFGTERCRYLCVFNWRGIKNNAAATGGIRRVMGTSSNKK